MSYTIKETIYIGRGFDNDYFVFYKGKEFMAVTGTQSEVVEQLYAQYMGWA